METNLLSAIKDALKNHWRAVIGEPEVKAQWMPQEYGVQYWEPSHERSLHLLLEELETVIDVELKAKDDKIERLEKNTASSDDLKAAEEELKQRNIEVEALEATKGRLELQIEELTASNTFLTRHNEELQGRLNDALEVSDKGMVKMTTVSTVISEDPLVIEDKDVPIVATSEINGVTPPKSGATKSTWDAADAILATGIKPTRSQVVEAAAASGVKEATAAAAYSQWCRYHSINSKNPELPFELKERRKGEKRKREEEAKPTAPVMRYFAHLQSDCVFMTHDGSMPDDGNVVELSKDEYDNYHSRKVHTALSLPPPPPAVILPPPPPPF